MSLERVRYVCECGASLTGRGVPEALTASFVSDHLNAGHKFKSNKRRRRCQYEAGCDCGDGGLFMPRSRDEWLCPHHSAVVCGKLDVPA